MPLKDHPGYVVYLGKVRISNLDWFIYEACSVILNLRSGTVHEYGSEEYFKYIPRGDRHPGSRAVIVVDIHKVGTVSQDSLFPTDKFIY